MRPVVVHVPVRMTKPILAQSTTSSETNRLLSLRLNPARSGEAWHTHRGAVSPARSALGQGDTLPRRTNRSPLGLVTGTTIPAPITGRMASSWRKAQMWPSSRTTNAIGLTLYGLG